MSTALTVRRIEPFSPIYMYFPFVCVRFPKLRLLDFRKIRQKDRQAAVELFRSKKGKEILKEIAKKARASAANPIIAESNSSKGMKRNFQRNFYRLLQ